MDTDNNKAASDRRPRLHPNNRMGRKLHFSFTHRGRVRHDRVETEIDIANAKDKKQEKLTYKGSLKVKPSNKINGNRQIGKSQNAMYAGQTKVEEPLKSELDVAKNVDAGQTRRVSASVGEIQELYSALHQLVPGQSRCKLSVPVPVSKLTKSQSMAMPKANAIKPRLDMDRKLTSPESMSSNKLTVGQRSQSQTMLNVLTSSPGTKRKQRRGSLDNLLQQRSDKAVDVPDGPSKSPVLRRKSVQGAVKCLEENKYNPTSKRASLVDAISILARDPGNVQRLLKEHTHASRNSSEGSQEMNNNDSKERQDQSCRKDSLLDDQMQQLLKSISELQSSDELDPSMNDEEVLRTLDRKGSVGTEMKDLLQALNELNSASNQNSAIASPAASSVEQSRRGSEMDGCKAPRETLDELEAFFSEKLKESTLKDKQQAVSPRRMVKQGSVESRDSDTSIPLSQTSSSRKESIESDNVSDGTACAGEKGDNHVTSQNPLDKPVQEKFAQQVCERLEMWLEKATALSEQEKESLRARAGCRKRSSRKRAKRQSENNDKNHSLASTETNPTLSNTPQEKTKLAYKAPNLQPYSSDMKKSRSLHNLIFGDDSHFKINFLQKFKSPRTGRHKKNKASKSQNNAALKLDRRRSRSLHDVPRRLPPTNASVEDILEKEAHGYTNPGPFPKSRLVPSTSGPSRLNSLSCDNLVASKSCENLVSLHKQACRASSSDSFGSADSQRGSGQCLAGRSHLPTDLPLFYTPDSSKATFLQLSRKANEPNTQNSRKETPSMRKPLFPHTERLKKYKRNVFYEESREQDKSRNNGLSSTSQNTSLVNPRPHLAQPSLKDIAKHPGPSHRIYNKTEEAEKTDDEVFATGHAYDCDEMMNLQLGAKHSESDNDSGCASTEYLNKVCEPGTSEMSVQTDPVIVLAEGASRTEYYTARARVKPTPKTLQIESLV